MAAQLEGLSIPSDRHHVVASCLNVSLSFGQSFDKIAFVFDLVEIWDPSQNKLKVDPNAILGIFESRLVRLKLALGIKPVDSKPRAMRPSPQPTGAVLPRSVDLSNRLKDDNLVKKILSGAVSLNWNAPLFFDYCYDKKNASVVPKRLHQIALELKTLEVPQDQLTLIADKLAVKVPPDRCFDKVFFVFGTEELKSNLHPFAILTVLEGRFARLKAVLEELRSGASRDSAVFVADTLEKQVACLRVSKDYVKTIQSFPKSSSFHVLLSLINRVIDYLRYVDNRDSGTVDQFYQQVLRYCFGELLISTHDPVVVGTQLVGFKGETAQDIYGKIMSYCANTLCSQIQQSEG